MAGHVPPIDLVGLPTLPTQPTYQPTNITAEKLRKYASFSNIFVINNKDRLCGLVVTVNGYGSRGTGFDSRR
jgi:hypothetical protein